METSRVLLTPEGWDVRDDQINQDVSGRCDDTESELECDSSSQSIPLMRYPSLDELSTVAIRCETSNVVSQVLLEEEKTAMAAPKAESCRYNQTTSIWNQDLPATPPKAADSAKTSTNQSGDDPLTPTANLKMLVSAASPIIRDRDTKKRELFPGRNSNTFEALHTAAVTNLVLNSNRPGSLEDESCVNENSSPMDTGGNKITISRKDKSLGLLCQKFLSKYPEYPKVNEFIEIGLDDVARDLSVERRRIYDIVNVLESVEVISRYAKNRYVWHGKSRLPTTLIKLKNYAGLQGFKLKPSTAEKEVNSKAKENKKEKANGTNCNASKKTKYKDTINEYCRKDKSLGVLSQKFLMMFLVSETRYVTLEDAANVLIGEEEEGQTKYKTKVRRLYDIANILSSLQLIEKVHIHSIQTGRKPGFRWIGIDPDKLELVAYSQEKIQNPPAVKRFCAAKNLDGEESAVGRLIRRRPSQQQIRVKSADTDARNCKLQRSRSERILGTKNRALYDNEEDGFSVQEITSSFGADLSTGSPTEVKFRAELQKLQQQYPDRMSQLLSACRQSDDCDAKKSRRSLFIPGDAEPAGSPLPKRRRSADDVSSIKSDGNGSFFHSISSPFKSISNDKKPKSPVLVNSCVKIHLPSPEQKILLERQKQQKLLEEQQGFDSQDERWKRIERELEKAFPKSGPGRPMMVHQSSSPLPYDALVEQSSVAIQASLIDDVSPLKPLSYYRKVKPLWHNSDSLQSSSQASPTPSPVQFQTAAGSTANSLSNPHALSPIPILPASERPQSQVGNACSGNALFLHIPNQASNGSSVLWATPTPPSGNSTPSPDQLIRITAPAVNTPLLYSPRSLTPTPEPGHLDSSQVSSIVENQQVVAATPLVTTAESQLVVIKNQAGNTVSGIPVQQALSIQVPHYVTNPQMFTQDPGSAQLKITTPLVKLVDLNRSVSMETPTTNTIQLLSDVSKRLSLPLGHESPS
ncbi:transcription factor E2F8-like isoform X4 [Montipora foliosa]|uniref:transcription factor E2F8-like isoform X4 n=1 Tax=Montipora foliosa TaxID=591990 RepID=UPI0035F1F8E2